MKKLLVVAQKFFHFEKLQMRSQFTGALFLLIAILVSVSTLKLTTRQKKSFSSLPAGIRQIVSTEEARVEATTVGTLVRLISLIAEQT